jgi:hypothetical protein
MEEAAGEKMLALFGASSSKEVAALMRFTAGGGV